MIAVALAPGRNERRLQTFGKASIPESTWISRRIAEVIGVFEN